MKQPSLFGDERAGPDDQGPRGPAEMDAVAAALATSHAQAAAVASRLPAGVRFGTSSWSFPGWAGIVYGARRSTSALARDGLVEYARHPLLRTVGIDRGYYAPVPAGDLERYASQLPDGFPCCIKAPASVTAAWVGAGTERETGPHPNPSFLSAEVFERDVLEPCARVFSRHSGPFLIECPPAPRGLRTDPTRFCERLDAMLERLPREFQYAVELRERALLTATYAGVLARPRASHVYNYCSAMPSTARQSEVVPPGTVPFAVVRLLLRPGTWYEDQRERFRPFDRLVEPDPAMRDDVVALVRAVLRVDGNAFVLVNNKAEGSAPLTIAALATRLAEGIPNASPA